MKRILLGMTLLAGMASCSSDEPANGDGNGDEMGFYEVEISYRGLSFDEEFPPVINFTMSGVTAENTPSRYYTKADGKVVELPSIEGTFTNNYYFSRQDTTITVFTDKNVDNLAVGKILIFSTSTGSSEVSYSYQFKKDGKVLKEGEDQATVEIYKNIEIDLTE